jgi:hypothetical protein
MVPVVVLALLFGAAPSPASAGPGNGPTAAVALGDSYISGKPGRWHGNSFSAASGNDATDRACAGGPPCSVDKSKVYVGGTDANECHRSDVAEILTASLPVPERINLSCSGGVTKNIFRAASGGVGQKDEQPQADQLAAVAQAKDVRLVQVSIGGNDPGFASIVTACLQAYATKGAPCNQTQQPKLDAAKPRVIADIEKAIDEVRAVRAEAGYERGDYRLIMQTYPSVIPRAGESRYAGTTPRARTSARSNDADLTWGRDSASQQVGGVVKTAATNRGVDLGAAFQSRELCAKTTSPADPLHPPSSVTSEWGRFLGASVIQQGDLQEAFHPNAFGQMAIASCVGQAFARPAGTFNCKNTPGKGPEAMILEQTGALAAPRTARSTPRLRLGVLRTVRRSGRTCATFSVRAGGKPIRGAAVRFAGRQGRTAKNGRVGLCARLARGSATAVAKRAGFRSSTVGTVRAGRGPR